MLNFLGFNKKEENPLEQRLVALETKLEAQKKSYEEQLRYLRQQLAAVVRGFPPTPAAILGGVGYSEIAKDQVASLIAETLELLILDVRADEGWNQGHIPGAKHIPFQQLPLRLVELADKSRPILTICANGNTALMAAQLLAKEGYISVYNALGGMAGYSGKLIKPETKASNPKTVKGTDRVLIKKILELLDREVRPGLKRDGGDLEVLSVEDGVVKLKMTGACLGCGSQKRTVEDGIKSHLMRAIPEVQDVEDCS